MDVRLDPQKASPAAYQAMCRLSSYIAKSSRLEPSLLELIKLRASQINGCAFCIAMHATEARAGGESEQRLYVLSAWRESSLFTLREQAALAWTEALTMITDCNVSDEVYQTAGEQFSDEELVNLSIAVVSINSWNRIAISFRMHPGIDPASGTRDKGASI